MPRQSRRVVCPIASMIAGASGGVMAQWRPSRPTLPQPFFNHRNPAGASIQHVARPANQNSLGCFTIVRQLGYGGGRFGENCPSKALSVGSAGRTNSCEFGKALGQSHPDRKNRHRVPGNSAYPKAVISIRNAGVTGSSPVSGIIALIATAYHARQSRAIARSLSPRRYLGMVEVSRYRSVALGRHS